MKRCIFSLLAALLATMLSAQSNLKLAEATIDSLLSKAVGHYAIAFKDLVSGEELLINARDRFHAASTMKTPLLIEVFKQANQKKFSLDDSVVVRNEFKSIIDSSSFSLDPADDSELSLYGAIGQKRTWRQLIADMITQSSNLATNMVVDLVGAANVMKTMRELGANDIQVLRGVEDSKAFGKGMNNTVTAFDLMIIFEAIAKGKAVNAVASRQMIDILLHQQFNSIIPAELPASVRVAHKTGSITGVLHDSGIVFPANNHNYVLVLLSKDIDSEESARKFLSSISKIIYDHVEHP
jgi:beta-lactamase class A